MKLRLAAPELVIDIGRLGELRYTRVDGDELAIGAGTRHHDLATSDVVEAEAPLLGAVARTVGDPQVRHRGTLGGSLAHADPASDLPAAVLALGARSSCAGRVGAQVPVEEFFTGLFSTALEPDELVVEIRVPRTGSAGWAYEKFTRRANDWAIVAVAVVDGGWGWSTWAPRRCGRRPRRRHWPRARRSRTLRPWPTRTPTRPVTSPPPPPTAVTWPAS
jgi:carbon-monoxide dehydrogenase medium subunit